MPGKPPLAASAGDGHALPAADAVGTPELAALLGRSEAAPPVEIARPVTLRCSASRAPAGLSSAPDRNPSTTCMRTVADNAGGSHTQVQRRCDRNPALNRRGCDGSAACGGVREPLGGSL